MQAQKNWIFLSSEGDTLDLISAEPVITEIFKIADVVQHVGFGCVSVTPFESVWNP